MSQSAIASGDPYASLVFINRPRASISRRTCTNHEPVVSYLNPRYGRVVTTVHLLTFIMLLL